jgi:hypothetical protein
MACFLSYSARAFSSSLAWAPLRRQRHGKATRQCYQGFFLAHMRVVWEVLCLAIFFLILHFFVAISEVALDLCQLYKYCTVASAERDRDLSHRTDAIRPVSRRGRDSKALSNPLHADNASNGACIQVASGRRLFHPSRTSAAISARCKSKLSLSVFLVIDDNPYGLIFLLSFL